MKTPTLRPALLALALAGLASPALALSILFRDVSTSGGMSADQLSAFQAAGNYWQGRFSDNVIVYIDIAFDSLGPNILASTGSSFVSTSYSSVRNRLVADAKSAADAVAVGHLPAAPALSFFATQGDLTSRFDNDGSLNNTTLGLTSANAKALGYAVNTDATHADASITFATGFAGDYVYENNNGSAVQQEQKFI